MDAAASLDAEFRAWVQAGDLRRAGEWLVSRYAGEVVGLCGAMVRDRTAAEDLAQDVFGRAFAALGGYRGEASARTWVLSIARNRCIDHLRRQKRDPWAASDGGDPDHHAEDALLPPDLLSRRDEVESALGELAEGERALVVLRFRHGLDYRELATAFGLKEGTVRRRVSRALARMREALMVPAQADFLESAELLSAPQAQSRSRLLQSRASAPRRRVREEEEVADLDRAAPPPPRAPAPAAQPSLARPAPAAAAAPPSFGAAPPPAGAPPPGAVRRGAAPPPGLTASRHPLAAYLAATDVGVSLDLRARLADQARAL